MSNNNRKGNKMPNKAITKAELAKCLVKNNSDKFTTQIEAMYAVNAVISCIEKNLEAGKDISLLGFGKFEVKHRAEREGRNPSTGQKMIIKASNVVNFKAGKGLKEAINK